jgi:Zn-dependent metalloprotease
MFFQHFGQLAAVSLLFLANAGYASAAEPSAQAKAAIEAARRANPKMKVEIAPATGLPSSIRGLMPQTAITASAPSRGDPGDAALRTAFETFFSSGALSAAYGTGDADSRVLSTPGGISKDRDIPGQYVVRGSQEVKGVPVFASDASMVLDRTASVLSASSNLSAARIADTVPAVGQEAAIAAAQAMMTHLSSKARGDQPFGLEPPSMDKVTPTAAIIVFDPAIIESKNQVSGPARLAWLVSIDIYRLFVDAKTGEVFYYFQDHPTVLTRRVFDLAATSSFPGEKVIGEDGQNLKDDVTADARTAFDYAGVVYEYYRVTYGRDGIADSTRATGTNPPAAAAALESYVRYGSIKNAYWCRRASMTCPNGGVMVYGPDYAAALDVVGHEMTHGVITSEANLNYADEPGAINEAFADIFGTLIEFYSRGSAGNWTIGEALPGYARSPLRNMADPHMTADSGATMFNPAGDYGAGNRGQPDHWSEYVRRDSTLCSGLMFEDNGCVHINSGILNKMAYLISEGGLHHGTQVTGIGKAKLGRIAYRTLTVHLNSGSGFQKTASAFQASCEELAARSIAGITMADCGQVSEAVRAVGLTPPAS